MWVRVPPPGPWKENMTNWNQRFVDLANHVAGWSKDRSTKVGAVIVGQNREVLSMGYNGFPRGIDDSIDERHERPAKYKWAEHAERNAIFNAARNGVRLEGSSIYLGWYPCCECARAIVQAGIKTLICEEPDFNHSRWGQDFVISAQIFNEGGIKVISLTKNDMK